MEGDSMKKGLTLTLVMVAIALSGYHSWAIAPVIDDITDFIVGDENSPTFPNLFVYPDAVNLNSVVNDPDGTDAQITWSFLESSGTYIINGVNSQAVGATTTTLITPGALAIAGPGVTGLDPADAQLRPFIASIDTSPVTITFRNKALSPIGGPNVNPGAAGIVAAQTKVLSLFASDGSTYTESLPIMVYTDNDGDDDTSPRIVPSAWTSFQGFTFTGTLGFHSVLESGAVTRTSTGSALCLEVTAGTGTTANKGEWQSPYANESAGGIDLIANTVYRVHLTASTTISNVNAQPCWMILFDNQEGAGDPRQGAACYGGEFVFLSADGQGGATAIGASPGRTDFMAYCNPLPVLTPQWNNATTGAFIAAYDVYNDMRIRFRAFDVDAGGWGGATDVGTICMTGLAIDKTDINGLLAKKAVTPDYDQTVLASNGIRFVGTAGNSTVAPAADGTLVTPTGAGWTNQYIQIIPGDGSLGGLTPAEVNDDYPVAWAPDTLYVVEAELSNPTPGAPEKPADLIRVGMDALTNELGYMNFIDSNLVAAGTPKATKATFVSFFFSHNQSLTPVPALARLRPRMDLVNAPNFPAPGNSTDPIKFHTLKVTKILNP